MLQVMLNDKVAGFYETR